MASVTGAIGDILGALGGGRSQVTTAGISAKVTQETLKFRQSLLGKLEKFGAGIGGRVGGDFFQAIANGANVSAAQARREEQKRLFGITTGEVKLYGSVAVVGLIGLVAYLAMRR